MNSKCLTLLTAQLQNELGGKVKSKGRTATIIGVCIVIVVVILYSFMLSYGLGTIGLTEVIPSYAVAITSLIMLFFTALKANGVLFAYKEYDFLMALPVKTSTVIASRFLTMFLLNTLLTAAIMLPMGAGYIVWETPGPLFYLEWISGIVITPLIPTTLASIFGILIILFSSRFKYANAVVTILSIGLIAAVFFVSLSMGQMGDGSEMNISQIKDLGQVILSQIHRLYPPALLYYEGLINGKLLSLAVFFAGSILWYYVFLKLIATIYKKLNTSMTTFHSKSHFQLTQAKTSSQISALCRKELKRFFSSSIYCINMGLGSVLTIVVSVVVLFVSEETLNQLLAQIMTLDTLFKVIPFVIGAVVSMTCTTCISLSLEGRNLWIIKSLPIEDVTIFKSKILMNLTLQLPVVFIAATAVNIRFPLTPVTRVMVFLAPTAYAFFTSVGGMFINLKMPEYEWTSETALVKQSLPSMAGMFGGLLAGIIPIGLLILLRNLNADIVTIIITAIIILSTYLLWGYVKNQKI